MTNFSIKPGMVRGDLFKESGKWAYTLQIDMSKVYDDWSLPKAIVNAARNTPSEVRGVVDSCVAKGSPYTLVVLDPYHKHSHPQMIKIGEYE